MINLDDILKKLSKERPIFHSEADFQHALAWKIHEEFSNINIRLEKPFKDIGDSKPWYIDIFCFNDDKKFAIELKYKTRGLKINYNGEEYCLKNQWAHDISRYDFIKDIYRLEKLVEDNKIDIGFAIFLTNDYLYWKKPKRSNTNDKDFRIHEGRILSGILAWAEGTSEGTMRGRTEPIKLKGKYKITWKDYSDLKKLKENGEI